MAGRHAAVRLANPHRPPPAGAGGHRRRGSTTPTSHLGLPALEVLEGALRDHPGALVVASHDRAFVEAIGVTRRLHVGGGVVREM